jgi:hypothetical protein
MSQHKPTKSFAWIGRGSDRRYDALTLFRPEKEGLQPADGVPLARRYLNNRMRTGALADGDTKPVAFSNPQIPDFRTMVTERLLAELEQKTSW